MPTPTTTTTSGIMPYGATFAIGSTTIAQLETTPDMGSPPNTVNVSSHDNTTREAYIAGRMDVATFDYGFIMAADAANYKAALANQHTPGTTYTITYPDGTGYTLTGEHYAYHNATNQSDAERFTISVVATDVVETGVT